jgi:hypothetical protein
LDILMMRTIRSFENNSGKFGMPALTPRQKGTRAASSPKTWQGRNRIAGAESAKIVLANLLVDFRQEA